MVVMKCARSAPPIAKKERADHIGQQEVLEGIHPHGPGRGLVLADGRQGPAVPRIFQGLDHHHGQHGQAPGPPDGGVGLQTLEPEGAVGEALEVVGQAPHHFAKPQGDDGQVIPPDPEDREAGEKAKKRRHHPPGQQSPGKRQSQVA